MPRLPGITGEAALGHSGPPAGKRFDAAGAMPSSITSTDRAGSRSRVHAGAILKPKTPRSILDQAGVSVDELVNLLK